MNNSIPHSKRSSFIGGVGGRCRGRLSYVPTCLFLCPVQTDASAPLHFSSSPSLHLMFSAPYVFPSFMFLFSSY